MTPIVKTRQFTSQHSDSSATTRFPAVRYITPLTTIGVTLPDGRPPVALGRYTQACISLPTFEALICVSGE
jgi:hypothetical protein